MDVCIIGAGYVGLVSGACLAERGHHVVCVDLDPAKADIINNGTSPFHEPGLDELLAQCQGRLSATTDLASAVQHAELTMIAVGTPFDGKTIDLTYIRNAARQIGEALRGTDARHTVVVKSTVVPGTTANVVRPILEEASGRTVGPTLGLGMNPEFLTEGVAVRDFQNPDRIVLGGCDEASIDDLERLYESFTGVPFVRTNPTTAEMIKYSSNSVLALLISFSNEMAALCAAVGDTDASEVMAALHLSQYFAVPKADGGVAKAPITSFLEPGCGFGGSCLPKDVAALAAHGAALGVDMRLLSDVLTVNKEQPAKTVAMVADGLGGLGGKRVAVLGLAFKPDTDDVRESPAFPIIRQLVAGGAHVVAHDPVAIPTFSSAFGTDDAVTFEADLRRTLTGADAVVLVTRWDHYRELDHDLAELGADPFVVDGRRLLDPTRFNRFAAIGRSA